MILNRLLISKQVSRTFSKEFKHRIQTRFVSTVDILGKIKTYDRRMESNKMKKSESFQQSPYRIYWQVIGAGNFGAPTSLTLVTESTIYFFNCGEGTQRIASFITMNKSLSQTKNVFITQSKWKNLGGLPGMCLTLRGYGCTKINIHGPPGCMDIYNATSNFMNLYHFKAVDNPANHFDDNCLKIQKIELKCDDHVMPAQIHDSWIIPQEVDSRSSEASADLKPYESSVQAYICKFKPRVGRLNAEKCVDFGVPPGPLFGQLKAGKDITLPDGRVVRSSDVMGDRSAVSSSIVLEVPHTKYLDSLLSNKKFMEAENLNHMFHLSPPEVVSDPRFVEWLKHFDGQVNHVFLNEDCSGIGHPPTRAFQEKLRLMNKNIFPELVGAKTDPCTGFDPDCLITNTDGIQRIEGKTGLILNVRPEDMKSVVMDEYCTFDQEETMKEVFESEEHKELDSLEEYKKDVNEALEHANSYLKEDKSESKEKMYPELTVLGSASAMPGKYRNNSSYLIEVKEDHFIFMDCGEGSLTQLCRLKGEEGTKRVLRNLKAIYISHQHADHHLGSINLLIAREETFQHDMENITPLYLVVTECYRDYLHSYHQNIQPILENVQLLKNEDLLKHTQKNQYMHEIPGAEKIRLADKDLFNNFLEYTSLSDIETCRALHCRHAFCVSFVTEDGFRVTYSGDTRPIPKLIELGKGSDLLIHEATMEHCLQKDAIIKKHSTFTEAIEIGKAMEAKFTLLTHFSARYSKFPTLEEIENEENVGISFDNLVLRPDNYHQLRLLYPALKVIFQKDMELMFDRTEKIHIAGDADMFPDYVDPKDQIINRINQRYEEKLENFKRIQKWRNDTVNRNEKRAEGAEPRMALPEGVSSLASKINPALANKSEEESPPRSPPRKEKDPWYQKPKQIKKQLKQAKNIHEQLLKIKSKDSSVVDKNVFRRRSLSPPGSTSPLEGKRSASPPDSPSTVQVERSASPPGSPPTGQVKRSISPPSPHGRAKPPGADVSERLIKVAKK